ncbi:hypothetical protein [Alistipes putredinis]|uniref:hypothetical protein n=1 Tax=Alistipes putredinis TaxID=28117 RepID=UPI003AB12227
MAKTQTTIPETDTAQQEMAVAAPPAATGEKDTATEKSPKKEQAPKAAAEIPAAALAILGKFPDYKELYIDADGSMYTPQTAPAIRGKAILYKNPYYKS